MITSPIIKDWIIRTYYSMSIEMQQELEQWNGVNYISREKIEFSGTESSMIVFKSRVNETIRAENSNYDGCKDELDTSIENYNRKIYFPLE